MKESKDFSLKTIMVTGAGSGIGRASAVALAEKGVKVVLVGRTEEKLKETLKLMKGNNHIIIPFDLNDYASYSELFDMASKNGGLDGLIHCAGTGKATPIKSITQTVIDEIMNINFKSLVFLIKYMAKKRYGNEGASIVACSAINAHYPGKNMSIYEASKMAIEGLVSGMAVELYTSRKIRINSMIIGPVATPMTSDIYDSKEDIGKYTECCPNLMGIADPMDISKMSVFLLGDDSQYTTGRSFYVDGGCGFIVKDMGINR